MADKKNSPVVLNKVEGVTPSLYSAMNSEMERLEASGRVSRYNALVPEYNSLIDEHQKKNTRYKEILDEYNGYVEIHNMIIDRQHNRQGLYEDLF